MQILYLHINADISSLNTYASIWNRDISTLNTNISIFNIDYILNGDICISNRDF